MVVGVLGGGAADEANLHLGRAGQYGLGRPLGKLEGVVLELVGKDGTALTIDLVAPVDPEVGLGGVELVESEGRHVLLLVVLGGGGRGDLLLGDAVELGSANQLDVIAEVEATVAVGGGRWFHPLVVVLVKEGVGKVKVLPSLGRFEDLLGEVLIDHGSLKTQTFGGVDALRIVVFLPGGLIGGLVNRQVIELRCVTLVKEEGTAG